METNPDSTAERLLSKLRTFIARDLDADERALLAGLLAPGVAAAYEPATEVQGYAVTDWSPSALPEALAGVLQRNGVKVEGLGL